MCGTMVRQQWHTFHKHQRLNRSRDEHEAIMQAIAEGNGEMASRRMRAHMLNAATSLSRVIETNKPVCPLRNRAVVLIMSQGHHQLVAGRLAYAGILFEERA